MGSLAGFQDADAARASSLENAGQAEATRSDMSDDESNGYEAIASLYAAGRGKRPAEGLAIGESVVRAWAAGLPPGAAVLDLGAGPGEPGTRILLEAGLSPYAVDASPTMVAIVRERFPAVPVECAAAESSGFFGRSFEGVLAWGLLFLLEPAVQAQVIAKVARALVPAGRFLFTAPTQVHEWEDAMTGRRSYSLGAREYSRLVRDAGLEWVASERDEGDNHFFLTKKRAPPAAS